jgi:hypothetical protein
LKHLTVDTINLTTLADLTYLLK